RGIARHPDFAAGAFDTSFIERELATILKRPAVTADALGAALAKRLATQDTDAGDPWQADGWRIGGARGRRLVLRGENDEETNLQVHATGNGARAFDWNGATHRVSANSHACVLAD